MSVAALQYDRFCGELVETRRAYTFTNDGELLVFPVRGKEVVPFWSSRSRLERIVKAHAKYEKFQISEYSWEEFLSWLSQLESEGIAVGANWSGPRLTGYDVSVADLRAALKHRQGSAA